MEMEFLDDESPRHVSCLSTRPWDRGDRGDRRSLYPIRAPKQANVK